jgi:hypothetical protein
MDTEAKIRKIFEERAATFIKMYLQIDERTSAYNFEESYRKAMSSFSHDLYQEIIGEEAVSKNERMQLLTSVGEITMCKTHPLAVAPGGFIAKS